MTTAQTFSISPNDLEFYNEGAMATTATIDPAVYGKMGTMMYDLGYIGDPGSGAVVYTPLDNYSQINTVEATSWSETIEEVTYSFSDLIGFSTPIAIDVNADDDGDSGVALSYGDDGLTVTYGDDNDLSYRASVELSSDRASTLSVSTAGISIDYSDSGVMMSADVSRISEGTNFQGTTITPEVGKNLLGAFQIDADMGWMTGVSSGSVANMYTYSMKGPDSDSVVYFNTYTTATGMPLGADLKYDEARFTLFSFYPTGLSYIERDMDGNIIEQTNMSSSQLTRNNTIQKYPDPEIKVSDIDGAPSAKGKIPYTKSSFPIVGEWQLSSISKKEAGEEKIQTEIDLNSLPGIENNRYVFNDNHTFENIFVNDSTWRTMGQMKAKIHNDGGDDNTVTSGAQGSPLAPFDNSDNQVQNYGIGKAAWLIEEGFIEPQNGQIISEDDNGVKQISIPVYDENDTIVYTVPFVMKPVDEVSDKDIEIYNRSLFNPDFNFNTNTLPIFDFKTPTLRLFKKGAFIGLPDVYYPRLTGSEDLVIDSDYIIEDALPKSQLYKITKLETVGGVLTMGLKVEHPDNDSYYQYTLTKVEEVGEATTTAAVVHPLSFQY